MGRADGVYLQHHGQAPRDRVAASLYDLYDVTPGRCKRKKTELEAPLVCSVRARIHGISVVGASGKE
jgi:hypothetical protein